MNGGRLSTPRGQALAAVLCLLTSCGGSGESGDSNIHSMVDDDAGVLAGRADAIVPVVTGPLSYDLDGVHKTGDLAFAKRTGENALQLGGSTEQNVLEIYIMRAVPPIAMGDYDCSSTSFMTLSVRSAFYTTELGSCTISLSDITGVGQPIKGTFSAKVQLAGETKT